MYTGLRRTFSALGTTRRYEPSADRNTPSVGSPYEVPIVSASPSGALLVLLFGLLLTSARLAAGDLGRAFTKPMYIGGWRVRSG